MEIKNCSGDISMSPVDCAKLDIKEFTFDTFIEDSTNRFAVVACKEFFSALPNDVLGETINGEFQLDEAKLIFLELRKINSKQNTVFVRLTPKNWAKNI